MGVGKKFKEFFGMMPPEDGEYLDDYIEQSDYPDKYSDTYSYGDSYGNDYPSRPGGTPLPPLERSRYGAGQSGLPYQQERQSAQIITVTPKNYAEAEIIGQRFREGNPVVVDLSKLEVDVAQRLVDFAAGLVYAMNGSMERIAKKVVLLSPEEIIVDDDDRRRLEKDYDNA